MPVLHVHTSTRRQFFMQLGAAAGLLAARPARAKEGRPNVLLIIADDLGYGDLACLGNPKAKTPNLDRLHDLSVRLTNFHVSPTGGPTRAALFTGRYAMRTGVWHDATARHIPRADETLMAQVFAEGGYRTALFGKWHLGDAYPFRPQDRGFQETLVQGGVSIGSTPAFWGNDCFGDTYYRNGVPEKQEGYCTRIWCEETAKFVLDARAEPFFVCLSLDAPHTPHNLPPEYAAPYLAAGIPSPRARHYGMITAMDEALGGLLERMEESGVAQDTLVIFMSDNGTEAGADLSSPDGVPSRDGVEVAGYNAGMRGKKGSVYDGGHRVPCFFRWPLGGLEHGKNVHQLTAHIDLLPTLIELCGLKKPRGADFDGLNFAPYLRDAGKKLLERTIFAVYQQKPEPNMFSDFAVITPRWRLIGPALYDMAADPGQMNNISEYQPRVREQLAGFYEEWWRGVTKRSDEYARFVLGANNEAVHLTAYDWVADEVPVNQQQVRAAMQCTGHWAVEIAEDGEYEFEVRRWPQELGLPIVATCPPPDLSGPEMDPDYGPYKFPSAAIPAIEARITIGGFTGVKAVGEGDNAVVFATHLPAGPAKLEAAFITADKGEWGAYYVSARLVS